MSLSKNKLKSIVYRIVSPLLDYFHVSLEARVTFLSVSWFSKKLHPKATIKATHSDRTSTGDGGFYFRHDFAMDTGPVFLTGVRCRVADLNYSRGARMKSSLRTIRGEKRSIAILTFISSKQIHWAMDHGVPRCSLARQYPTFYGIPQNRPNHLSTTSTT